MGYLPAAIGQLAVRWKIGMALATLLCGAAAAVIQTAQAQQNVQVTRGIRYACTGIGVPKDDPRWAGFSLKLVYAVEPRGALLSDVRTVIEDLNNALVLDVYCPNAPWLVADLQPGRYRVTATAVGRFTKSVRVTVKRDGQSKVVVRFPEPAGDLMRPVQKK